MGNTMLPAGTFDGQVAVVTGGGSGIGLAIATQLVRLGARAVLASRNPERLQAAAERLQEAEGGQALAIPTDVRQPEAVHALFQQVRERFGRVDLLVNAAAGNFIVDSERLSVNGWNAVVASVLHGTFYCTREAGLAMIEGGGGRILNVVATYGWTGGPKTVHSVAAKAGVIAMTRTLAVEWAHYGIRVNAIAPGPTDTEGARPLWANPEDEARLKRKIPVGRFASPEEIAYAASYLLSPYADFVNGEVFVIDGGEWLGKGLVGE
jgi:NAD(P)-dependent dehydrogenase (short-subunit alcohol dehydrogenase family)